MAIAVLGAFGVGGCTAVFAVGADVARPATVPLRVFPRIVVVAEATPESDRLGSRLVTHLEAGRSTVERASAGLTERQLAEGTLPPGTAVVVVHAILTQRDRSIIARRQTLECGPLGCQSSRRNRIEATTVVTGHAVLTVFDGSSGRNLQRETVTTEEVGRDALGMRLRVFEQLVTLTGELVDQRTEHVTIELLPSESEGVRAALLAIEHGEWPRGRALLEAVAASSAFAMLPPEERALVLYDLGQAHRFDESVPADVRFARASESLRAALLLDPQTRFANALDELGAHRRSRQLLLAQREAESHNFRLAQEDGSEPIPSAPSSYRRRDRP